MCTEGCWQGKEKEAIAIQRKEESKCARGTQDWKGEQSIHKDRIKMFGMFAMKVSGFWKPSLRRESVAIC